MISSLSHSHSFSLSRAAAIVPVGERTRQLELVRPAFSFALSSDNNSLPLRSSVVCVRSVVCVPSVVCVLSLVPRLFLCGNCAMFWSWLCGPCCSLFSCRFLCCWCCSRMLCVPLLVLSSCDVRRCVVRSSGCGGFQRSAARGGPEERRAARPPSVRVAFWVACCGGAFLR